MTNFGANLAKFKIFKHFRTKSNGQKNTRLIFMKKKRAISKIQCSRQKKRKIRGKRKFKIIIDRPPRAFVFLDWHEDRKLIKKKEHISQKKSKKNYTTYTLKILRFYETLLFMQFELLFSSICDFVKIDVLTLPPELSCLLFSVRSILFSWLPFFLSPLIPILRKEFNKNQNLEKKQKNLKIYCLTI